MGTDVEALVGISVLIRANFWKATRKRACRWTPKNLPPFAPRMHPAVLGQMLHLRKSVKSPENNLMRRMALGFARAKPSAIRRIRLFSGDFTDFRR